MKTNQKMMSKKIIISRGYGAGWSSWQWGIPTKFACEYQPLIKAIESDDEALIDEALVQYKKDVLEKFDEDYVYCGGKDGFAIVEIPEGVGYRITEYDGAEGVELETEVDWN